MLIFSFLLVSALFLFVDSRTTPVVLWDESRNVVNALEMRHVGIGLVTTYDFHPDLWNTKPPLLIWLMTASMALFGPSEWAMRLPSAVAALGTLLCLLLFVRKVTGSLATALLSAAILLLSPGFFGEHGARTADYDALLLFFVTAALQLSFFAVHRRHPSPRLLLAIGALIGAGAMTKSIAVFIPFAAAVPYILLQRRLPRMLRSWRRYAFAALVAIAPLILFYAVRESLAPGYFAAVLHNDMGGRFGETLIGKTTSPALYSRELFFGWFFAGPLLLAAPLALRQIGGKKRLLMLWSLSITLGTVLIFSLSSTRLIHYSLPAFPWIAIVAALSLRWLSTRFIEQPFASGRKGAAIAIASGLILVTGALTGRSLHWRYSAFPDRQFYPQASYGELFALLHQNGVTKAIVVDPGFPLEGRPGYVPLLRAYRLMWSEKGLSTVHRSTIPAAARSPVVTCEPGTGALLRHRAHPSGIAGCILFR